MYDSTYCVCVCVCVRACVLYNYPQYIKNHNFQHSHSFDKHFLQSYDSTSTTFFLLDVNCEKKYLCLLSPSLYCHCFYVLFLLAFSALRAPTCSRSSLAGPIFHRSHFEYVKNKNRAGCHFCSLLLIGGNSAAAFLPCEAADFLRSSEGGR